MAMITFLDRFEIGTAIRRRRLQLNLSQEDLAERLKISHQQVQRYESGKNVPNVENIQHIARALSVPVGYFFDAAASSPPSPKEQELIASFRNIPEEGTRALLLNLSRLAAGEARG